MRDVRQGMTNYDVTSSFSKFVAAEIFFCSILLAFLLPIHWLVGFISSLVVLLIIVFTPIYPILGFIFSLAWGYLGYIIFHSIGQVAELGNGWIIVFAIGGALLGFAISFGARAAGKQYFDDISY